MPSLSTLRGSLRVFLIKSRWLPVLKNISRRCLLDAAVGLRAGKVMLLQNCDHVFGAFSDLQHDPNCNVDSNRQVAALS
jgi:hypothetical protein